MCYIFRSLWLSSLMQKCRNVVYALQVGDLSSLLKLTWRRIMPSLRFVNWMLLQLLDLSLQCDFWAGTQCALLQLSETSGLWGLSLWKVYLFSSLVPFSGRNNASNGFWWNYSSGMLDCGVVGVECRPTTVERVVQLVSLKIIL